MLVAKRWIWGLWVGVPFVASGALLMSLATTVCRDVVTSLADCPYDFVVDKPTYPWAWSLVLLGGLIMALSVIFLFVSPILEKHSSSLPCT